jgi:hypothetical protein
MSLQQEIARQAALLIVDEGLEYGPAKRKAVKLLRLQRVAEHDLPDNEAVEREVRLYLDELDDPAHAQALTALRRAALALMRELRDFRPHLTGAVWRGTATAHSDIHLQLFEDDSKRIEIDLANRGIDYQVGSAAHFGGRERVETLSFTVPCGPPVGMAVAHLALYAANDERGALKSRSNGQPDRGNLAAVERLLERVHAA